MSVTSKKPSSLKSLVCAIPLVLILAACSSSSDNSSSSSAVESSSFLSFNFTQSLSSSSAFSVDVSATLSDSDVANDTKLTTLNEGLRYAAEQRSFSDLGLWISTELNAEQQEFADFIGSDAAIDIITDAIAQDSISDANKNIFILAAGNDVNQTLAKKLADAVVGTDTFANVITVGGYQYPNVFADYVPGDLSTLENSSSVNFDNCGDTSDRCLIMPLRHTLLDKVAAIDELLAGDTLSDYGQIHYQNLKDIYDEGSQYGTRHVSIALTYIDAFFNGTISTQEVASRALAVANLTECQEITGSSDASICGQGTLQIEPTLIAIGQANLKFGPSIHTYNVQDNAFFVSLGKSNLQPITSSVETQSVLVIDSLGAPFKHSLADHINIASGVDGSAMYLPGNNYRYSNVEKLSDFSAFQEDIAFHHGSKVQNSKGISFFNDASLGSVSSLRSYETQCFASCLMSDDSMAFITGDMIQASLGDGKRSLSFAGCLGDGSLSCAVLGSKMNLVDNLVLKTSLVSAKQDHLNGEVNEQWFGMDVGHSLATSGSSNSESFISKVGLDYLVSDSVSIYVELEDTQSEWTNLASISLLDSGALHYQKQFAGIEWFKPSQHLRLQLTQHQVDNESNYLRLNLPQNRTRAGELVYEQYDLPLASLVDSEVSVLYYLTFNQQQDHATQLSFVFDTPIDHSLSADYSKVKLALSHQWK